MRKLLSANVTRLFKNKAFWITVWLMMMLQLIINMSISRQLAPMDITLLMALEFIGVLSSIFFSLLIGTEYSDGTIRNKLIAGHKRSHIYLASLLNGWIAISVIYAAGILTGVVTGMVILAPPIHEFSVILLSCVIGWMASISYISIFNFIGMLSSSKAKTSIICIMTAFLIIFMGMFCFSLLADGQNAVILFLYEYNPFGQTIQAMSMNLPAAWKYGGYSLSLTCILAVVGIYLFRKKDLK